MTVAEAAASVSYYGGYKASRGRYNACNMVNTRAQAGLQFCKLCTKQRVMIFKNWQNKMRMEKLLIATRQHSEKL